MTAAPVLHALQLALLAGALACGPAAGEGQARGVLLIAVDALRADHLGVYGYDRDTSPTLAQLAREGLRFDEAFASAPQLIPAHASLLSGCAPDLARRFLAPEFEGPGERRWRLPARAPHLAIEFLAAGYATAAFSDHALLSEPFGFERGFQRWEILDEASAGDWEGEQSTRVVEHFLQWLRELPRGRPWFAYLHLNELERCWSRPPQAAADEFFQPRPELDEIPPVANTDTVFFAIPRSRWRGGVRSLGQYEAAYDGEIRSVDAEIGRLCASLRRLGRYDTTSIHVVGTFGMQLGESGLYLSAGRYSRADLGVPWIFRPAAPLAQGAAAARGVVVPGLASLMDVAPTLLALEGLRVPEGMHGSSQAAVLESGRGVDRPYVYASCGLQEGCAVIGERHAFEYVFPLGPANPMLRRSWTGQWFDLEQQPHLALQARPLFYDRRATPYPPLDAENALGPGEDFAAFRSAAVEWMRQTNEVRRGMQGSGLSEIDAAALRRMREKNR